MTTLLRSLANGYQRKTMGRRPVEQSPTLSKTSMNTIWHSWKFPDDINYKCLFPVPTKYVLVPCSRWAPGLHPRIRITRCEICSSVGITATAMLLIRKIVCYKIVEKLDRNYKFGRHLFSPKSLLKAFKGKHNLTLSKKLFYWSLAICYHFRCSTDTLPGCFRFPDRLLVC